MITSKHLGELLNFKTPMPAVASLYLEVGPDNGYVQAARRLLQDAKSPDPALAQTREDLERIERYVVEEFQSAGFRGLAVFSSKRFGLWRACPLPEPVKTGLRVDVNPHLAPLLSMTDQHHRFGVVLSDAAKTRFLEVFLGQVSEYEEMLIKPAAGAPEHAYLKEVSEKLDGLARNQGFQRIVLGVSPELALKLVNHLHSSLQHNLILDAELSPDVPAAGALARIQACEDQARQVRETVLTHRLIDAAKTGPRLAVLGLDRTLQAVQNGQVRVLFVRDGYAKMGRRCPECGKLSISWTKCLDCGRSTQIVFNLVAELAERALSAGCEVFRLFHDTPLDNLGRIGAELTCDPPEGAGAVDAPERAAVRAAVR